MGNPVSARRRTKTGRAGVSTGPGIIAATALFALFAGNLSTAGETRVVGPLQSPHQELVCEDCHSGDVEDPLGRQGIIAVCGSCHEQARDAYRASSHGADMPEKNDLYPTCITCHGTHDVVSTADESDVQSNATMVRTCSGCHEDPSLIRHTELSADVVQLFEETFHGLAFTHGITDVAGCVTCHGHHMVLPADDPRSRMHPDNLEEICLGCHPSVSEEMIAAVKPSGGEYVRHSTERLRVYYPVAGTGVNSILVIGIGGVVGFLSALFGAGGGFLMTPLLILIGVPAAVAVSTNATQITAGAGSGALTHARFGGIDYRMGAVLVVGGILGGCAGVRLMRVLRETGNFDFLLHLAYVLILGFLGFSMFIEGARTLRGRMPEAEYRPSGLIVTMRNLPLRMRFRRSGIEASMLLLGGAGFVDGILVALIGVGGGFFMLPVMIYLVGVPTRIAAGTILFHVVLTAGSVSFQQATVNHTVDLLLALTLFAGSVVGSQIGSLASRRLKGEQIRVLFAIAMLVVMALILAPLLGTPDNLVDFTLSGGGR